MAQALEVSYDGVAHIALRRYASRRGVTLPRWVAPARGLRGPAKPSKSSAPKLWFRFPPEWEAGGVLEGLQAGEVNTNHGVIREAIRQLYLLGSPNDVSPRHLKKREASAAWRAEAERPYRSEGSHD